MKVRNDDVLQIADNKNKASIEINSIELKIMHIFPNDDLKYNLLQTLTGDMLILIDYRKLKF